MPRRIARKQNIRRKKGLFCIAYNYALIFEFIA
nr:MAG TPA: hypothetical protein [Caudoviricetes sp.]